MNCGVFLDESFQHSGLSSAYNQLDLSILVHVAFLPHIYISKSSAYNENPYVLF